jgi:hypothetical protein
MQTLLTTLAIALMLSTAACSTEAGGKRLRVGNEAADAGDGAGQAGRAGSAGAGGLSSSGGDGAFDVRIEDASGMTIEVVTLHCDGECAQVEAVASGGNPPYRYSWEDGSTAAARRVCLDASTTLSVTATDTASAAVEFSHAAQTATTELTATVLGCGDGGVPVGDGGFRGEGFVYWTTWTAMTLGEPGSASGTLAPPGGEVSVAYSGEAIAPSAITGQPSTLLVGVATFTPESTYQSGTVTNAPPPSGMIVLAGDPMLTQTITFSAPVRDPLIGVMSLGNFGMAAQWTFDAAPVVLSTGPGIANQNGTLTVSGNTLTGVEGYGVVELAGTFSSISFTVPVPESAALFTVGIRGRE